jgi:HD-GYP domain-containing protein (c-di-GMP phosphodiesterase class II)
MSAVVRAGDDRDSLGAALAALNLIVLRRETDGRFQRLNSAPDWSGLLGQSAEATGGGIELAGRSDFLDNFLIDAQALWLKGEPGRIHSGLWLETDARGSDWPLEAQAVVASADQLLIIQQLSEEYAERVQVMQSARNHLLAEEALEREVMRRTAAVRQREEEIAIRLLAAAGTRDEETGSHVRRIGLFSAALGTALGWDAVRTADIRVAAPMHDIGKIGVPDAILQKPGALTEEEWIVMRGHTRTGAQILAGSKVPFIQMAAEISVGHHEKWDGSGYPSGKQGEQIPIEARITALVDVFDALSSKRHYKEAWPDAEVESFLREKRGSHFDPQLCDLFLANLGRFQEILRQNPDDEGTQRLEPAPRRR